MQGSNQPSQWFQVSLRFQGDGLPVKEIESRLNIKPSSLGSMGEHVDGNPKRAKYTTNIWVWASAADSSVDFEQQIGEMLQLLEPKKDELAEILALSDVKGELFLGFSSSNEQGSAYFSPPLLAWVSALGLALNLDLYSAEE